MGLEFRDAGQLSHVMIHHSATADGATFSWAAIRRFHMEDPGHLWGDIGYHFGVELVGEHHEVLIGRAWDLIGAHCPQDGMNRRALGVCVVGNWDVSAPPEAALIALRDYLLRPILREWGIRWVTTHRAHNPAKSCPGRLFTDELIARHLPSGMSLDV